MGGATWTVEHKISKIIQGHAIKFGGIYATRGTGRREIDNPVINYANEADLLANVPSQVLSYYGTNPFRLYMPEWGVFLQDDWRATPKLTLNLGLRYDWYGNAVVHAPGAPKAVPVEQAAA